MSKRPEYEFAKDTSGKVFWRSMNELEGDAALEQSRAAEFPPGVTDPPDGVSRRDFFNLMGAATAMAGVAACRRPEEKIVPYANAPEQQIPGKPLFYATAVAFGGTAMGLLVETHDGRPTKLEGNPQHPDSAGGGLTPWMQASILDMYDPDRSANPREKGEDRTWAQATAALRAVGQKARAKQGAGLAILTHGHRSLTTQAMLGQVRAAFPQARVVRYEPLSRDAQRDGARLAFGKPLETVLDVSKAKVIVTLDADILGTEGSIVKNARGFAAGRTAETPAQMNRLYAVESSFSTTGASADHRLRLASRDVTTFAFALAAALSESGVGVGELAGAGQQRGAGLPQPAVAFAKAVAKDLAARRGQGLIVAGAKQPAAVHALVHALNVALGNTGSTVKWVRAFDDAGEGPAGLVALSTAIADGAVDTLIILGGNPAFDAPADAAFAQVLEGASKATIIHLSHALDETSKLATWHLNRSHELETWSDVVAEDGTASITQPMIAPLFDSRGDAEMLSILLGAPQRGYDLVRAVWAPRLGLDFEKKWRRALHDGVVENSAFPAEAVTSNTAAVAGAARALAPAGAGLEITFNPDCHVYDGRFANNSWLQEFPDPMTKVTWSNSAAISPATAKRLGVKDGGTVSLQVGEGLSARVAVVVQPGQAEDSIALTVGQGRTAVGRVGKGIGTDVYPLRASTAMGYAGDVKLSSLGGNAELARTQEHFALEGRPHVRVGTVDQYEKHPEFAKEMVEHPPLISLWEDQKVDIIHKWGLAIDLNTCTGCGSCMVACYAENNISVVGKQGVRNSREMCWIRVDRYYEGSADDPRSVAQPLPCQQCENAPCEQVCPVAATTHSPEGLNDMAYNRCVGTRYCANNCPFKVRKFNFFNYTKDTPKLKQMQYNPDVTVRSRGVMEKCTFCVQRINAAKIEGKRNATDVIADGAIRTACEQACPSGAITFGDLNDKKARVSEAFASPRSYFLLEELNVRPRVAYLARIRNINPELERA